MGIIMLLYHTSSYLHSSFHKTLELGCRDLLPFSHDYISEVKC